MTKSKPKITVDDVRRLGALAKISLNSAEEEGLRKELSSILEYFHVVDKVEDGVVVDELKWDAVSLRRDEVGPSDPEGVLKGVPQRKGRFVKAPRVF
jgi:aspartyl/glutamyl-tRNA(Asn/Gln) amidotransferase C subunit